MADPTVVDAPDVTTPEGVRQILGRPDGSTRVAFTLPAELVDAATDRAKQRGVSASRIVEDALREYLDWADSVELARHLRMTMAAREPGGHTVEVLGRSMVGSSSLSSFGGNGDREQWCRHEATAGMLACGLSAAQAKALVDRVNFAVMPKDPEDARADLERQQASERARERILAEGVMLIRYDDSDTDLDTWLRNQGVPPNLVASYVQEIERRAASGEPVHLPVPGGAVAS